MQFEKLKRSNSIEPKSTSSQKENTRKAPTKIMPVTFENTKALIAPLDKQIYFHGALTRPDVQDLLTTNGDFLVRTTISRKAKDVEFVLSVQWNSDVHIIIHRDKDGFQVESCKFPKVHDLVWYYWSTGKSINSKAAGELTLKRAVGRFSWRYAGDHDDIVILGPHETLLPISYMEGGKGAPLIDQPYYHGFIPRDKAIRLLRRRGDFLVRKSIFFEKEEVVVSMLWTNGACHVLVMENKDGKFHIDQHTFDSIPKLIYFYWKHGLALASCTQAVPIRATLRQRSENTPEAETIACVSQSLNEGRSVKQSVKTQEGGSLEIAGSNVKSKSELMKELKGLDDRRQKIMRALSATKTSK